MALDTDPGIGIGTPIPYTPPTVDAGPQRHSCVSFARSLEILMVDNKQGAYGFKSPEACAHFWEAYIREGWIDKMRMAEAELKRDLGAPICPEAHYNELHPLRTRIKLRQAPVAYIGRHTFGDWTEVNLTEDGNGDWYFELCDQDIAPNGIDDVQFSYADSTLECYSGLQTLQSPCVLRIEGTCSGSDDGYRMVWPLYQLVKPDVDETEASETADFITAVKWRTAAIDSANPMTYELVGECNCSCCGGTDPIYTLTLEDAVEGIVCIECDDLVSQLTCVCQNRQIRINYATAFDWSASIDPGLEEAIVLLALVKANHTPVKPCGCDNRWVDQMLEIDPTAQTEFATKLSYGPTVAGMRVMRTINKYLKRPHFNQEVFSGGLFSGKKARKRDRSPSYLRGF